MAAPHVTSEELALLAMEADVDDDVRTHVASCPSCTKDLALIRSLLDADAPDNPEPHVRADNDDPTTQSDPPPAAATAMADAADGRPVVDPSQPAPRTPDAPNSGPAADGAGEARRHSYALVGALIVAAALIVVVMLLWR